jgi:predicted transglutaminase-like cysteine proteinase
MWAPGLLPHAFSIIVLLSGFGFGHLTAHPMRFASLAAANIERAPQVEIDQPVRLAALTRPDPEEGRPDYRPAPAVMGPFATLQRQVADGPVSAKWRHVQQDIETENELLAVCRSDRANCPSKTAVFFLAIIDRARAREGRARIGEVNRSINLAIRPISDQAGLGMSDVWTAPLATLAAGVGDCKDYAVAKYVALEQAGVPDEDLRLVIVRDARVREDHAVVTVRLDGHWLVLDNRWLALAEDTELPRFAPLFSLGQDGASRLISAQEREAEVTQTDVYGNGRQMIR